MINFIKVSVFMTLFLFSMAVASFQGMVKFDSPQQEAEYRELIKELRCPKCQNQNIADSNAIVAKDMRTKSLELLKQGQNKDQVVEYMINRYGQFAHYKPPVNVATIMLWAIPSGFIMLCIFLLWRKSKLNVEASYSQNVETISQDLEEMLRKVEDEQSKVGKNK